MKRKITPADRFRQELMGSVAGARESFSGYCRLAAQAMLQSAMEIEAADFIGRTTYQRREEDQATYRNRYKRRKVVAGPTDRFGYVGAHGYQAHDGVPFLHVGARYYDPGSGRFLQRDPLGIRGGLNVYAYLRSQPTIGIDPYGEFGIFGFEFNGEWGGSFLERYKKGCGCNCRRFYTVG